MNNRTAIQSQIALDGRFLFLMTGISHNNFYRFGNLFDQLYIILNLGKLQSGINIAPLGGNIFGRQIIQGQ